MANTDIVPFTDIIRVPLKKKTLRNVSHLLEMLRLGVAPLYHPLVHDGNVLLYLYCMYVTPPYPMAPFARKTKF